jgi:hypothetical protein
MAAESLACFLTVIGCPSQSTSYMSFPSAHVKVTVEMNLNYHNYKPQVKKFSIKIQSDFFWGGETH